MKIDDDWFIVDDSYGCTLVHRRITEARGEEDEGGREVFDKYYFASIQQCLKRYVQEVLKPCEDVQKALQRIDEIEKKIDSFVNK